MFSSIESNSKHPSTNAPIVNKRTRQNVRMSRPIYQDHGRIPRWRALRYSFGSYRVFLFDHFTGHQRLDTVFHLLPFISPALDSTSITCRPSRPRKNSPSIGIRTYLDVVNAHLFKLSCLPSTRPISVADSEMTPH